MYTVILFASMNTLQRLMWHKSIRLFGSDNLIFVDSNSALLLFYRESKEQLDETTVTLAYPGLFKTESEQRTLFQRYMKSFYYNRTKVNTTFATLRSCSFYCAPKPQKRKKRAVDSYVYHGCCQS